MIIHASKCEICTLRLSIPVRLWSIDLNQFFWKRHTCSYGGCRVLVPWLRSPFCCIHELAPCVNQVNLIQARVPNINFSGLPQDPTFRPPLQCPEMAWGQHAASVSRVSETLQVWCPVTCWVSSCSWPVSLRIPGASWRRTGTTRPCRSPCIILEALLNCLLQVCGLVTTWALLLLLFRNCGSLQPLSHLCTSLGQPTVWVFCGFCLCKSYFTCRPICVVLMRNFVLNVIFWTISNNKSLDMMKRNRPYLKKMNKKIPPTSEKSRAHI